MQRIRERGKEGFEDTEDEEEDLGKESDDQEEGEKEDLEEPAGIVKRRENNRLAKDV